MAKPLASHPLLNSVLFALAPHPSLEGPLKSAFGKLIGSWDLTMKRYSPANSEEQPLELEGEWHFGWVLNGLAMQDVWIVPKRSISSSQSTPEHTFWTPILAQANPEETEFLEYGTTIRFFVPGKAGEKDCYRAVWAGPRQGKSYLFSAKVIEGGLEMLTNEGKDEMKWCLTEIGEESFEWREWMRGPGEAEWWVREKFSCRRMK